MIESVRGANDVGHSEAISMVTPMTASAGLVAVKQRRERETIGDDPQASGHDELVRPAVRPTPMRVARRHITSACGPRTSPAFRAE